MLMQRRSTAFSRGFTLLEVLVVVFLVGIISSIAMLGLNASGDERRMRDESDRLVALLLQVASEAVMQNQEYGLKITDTGYLFLCLDEVKLRWKACSGDDTLRERNMPEGLEIHVLRESSLTLPHTKDGDDKDVAAKAGNDGPRIYPDLLLLSSGEASPVSLEIRVSEKPELRSEIRVDELARVSRDTDEPETKAAGSENP
jgi:general secretion pathway protein H